MQISLKRCVDKMQKLPLCMPYQSCTKNMYVKVSRDLWNTCFCNLGSFLKLLKSFFILERLCCKSKRLLWCGQQNSHLKNVKNTHGGVLILKPATLLKLTLLYGRFSRFLNCTNGTKSRNAPHVSNVSWNNHSLRTIYDPAKMKTFD